MKVRGTSRRDADLERRLVWVFGSPRTGSTWFLGLICAHDDVVGMDEPGIGMHLAQFTPDALGVPAAGFEPDQLRVNDSRAADPDYFFAERYAEVWRPSVRSLLLSRLGPHLEERGSRRSLMLIKEPNGSLAADLVMSALPGARLLWMLRDGRDVVDSQLDAAGPRTWLSSFGGALDDGPAQRLRFLTDRAHLWVARTRAVQRAYDAHPPALRRLVRYEDLRADTLPVVRETFTWLGLEPPADLGDVVARQSFEALPDAAKGPGKFARSASPGAWRDNLTPEEQAAVDAVMGPLLTELGYPPR